MALRAGHQNLSLCGEMEDNLASWKLRKTCFAAATDRLPSWAAGDTGTSLLGAGMVLCNRLKGPGPEQVPCASSDQ